MSRHEWKGGKRGVKEQRDFCLFFIERLPESDNLPQGTGLFAFEFLLPPGLPPSFTSPLGGWPICGDTIFQMGLVEEDYIISQCGFLCYCLDLLRRDRGREVIRFRQLIHIITRPSLGVDASASVSIDNHLSISTARIILRLSLIDAILEAT